MCDTVNNVGITLPMPDLRHRAIYGLTWICPSPLEEPLAKHILSGDMRSSNLYVLFIYLKPDYNTNVAFITNYRYSKPFQSAMTGVLIYMPGIITHQSWVANAIHLPPIIAYYGSNCGR